MANKTRTIKKTGTYKGKSNKLGGGGRFQQVKDKAQSFYEKKGKSPKQAKQIAEAVAAKIGRKSLGKKRFQKLAAAGKRRSKK